MCQKLHVSTWKHISKADYGNQTQKAVIQRFLETYMTVDPSKSVTFRLACCEYKATELLQLVWTDQTRRSQRPEESDALISNKHLQAVWLNVLAPPVVRNLAGPWAVSQNSIINVRMDLLTGISRSWLPTLWEPCTVCCETFVQTRTTTDSSKAFKPSWIDQGTQRDVKYTHPDEKLRGRCPVAHMGLWG